MGKDCAEGLLLAFVEKEFSPISRHVFFFFLGVVWTMQWKKTLSLEYGWQNLCEATRGHLNHG